MTRRIQTPDGTIHEFPDAATDEQISAALSSANDPMQARIAGMSENAKRLAQTAQKSYGFSDELAQGATLGFTDELNAAGLAAIDWIRNKVAGRPMADMITDKGKSFEDLYNDYVDAQRIARGKYQKEHPIAATTGQLLGGLGSMAPGAGVVATPLTTAQAMKTGALTGGAYGAVQGFGSGEGGLGNRLTGAAIGGTTGAALGAAIPGALSLFSKTPVSGTTTADIRQRAQDAFASADAAGATIPAADMDKFISDVATSPEIAKTRLNPKLHPDSVAAMEELYSRAGQDATLGDLHQLRQIFGDAASGPLQRDRRIPMILQDKLDDFIGQQQGGPELMQGIQDWARFRKSDLIEQVLGKADIGAAISGTGGNLDNKTRQALAALVTNKRTANLWTDEERQMLLAVARGEPLTNFLRSVGRFSPKGNALTATLEIMMGPHLGMPVAAVGMGAKALADRATQQGAQQILSLVQNGQLTPQAMAKLSPQMQALARAMMMEGTQQATQRLPPLIGAQSP